MALRRTPPTCIHCGEPIAKAKYRKPKSPFFVAGDTFQGWEYFDHDCQKITFDLFKEVGRNVIEFEKDEWNEDEWNDLYIACRQSINSWKPLYKIGKTAVQLLTEWTQEFHQEAKIEDNGYQIKTKEHESSTRN